MISGSQATRNSWKAHSTPRTSKETESPSTNTRIASRKSWSKSKTWPSSTPASASQKEGPTPKGDMKTWWKTNSETDFPASSKDTKEQRTREKMPDKEKDCGAKPKNPPMPKDMGEICKLGVMSPSIRMPVSSKALLR